MGSAFGSLGCILGASFSPPSKRLHAIVAPTVVASKPSTTGQKRTPYLCNKCLLINGVVQLKSEHKGSCPAAGGGKDDYSAAEARAKKEMEAPLAQNFDSKQYLKFLKQRKAAEYAKLVISDQAKHFYSL